MINAHLYGRFVEIVMIAVQEFNRCNLTTHLPMARYQMMPALAHLRLHPRVHNATGSEELYDLYHGSDATEELERLDHFVQVKDLDKFVTKRIQGPCLLLDPDHPCGSSKRIDVTSRFSGN